MVVISKSTLKSGFKSYPEAEQALSNWYDITKHSDWKNFNEMRKTFNSVDAVGNDRYVFNIKGNQYRQITCYTALMLWIASNYSDKWLTFAVVFAIVEIIITSIIVWYASKWPRQSQLNL